VLALPLASTPAAAADAPVPGAGFEVERYAIALRPDLATAAVSGSETITVRSMADGIVRLTFSGNALRISEATVNGKLVGVTSGPGTIVFTLPRPLAKGSKASIRFRVEGRPARGMVAAGGGVYTSYFACDWMVCLQDVPGDKAHLDLDLYLPDGIHSVGVGDAAAPKRLQGGLALHRWRSTRPWPTYVFGFAAGPFPRRSVRSPAGELLYFDATGTGADLPRLFAQAPAIAAFFADKAGLPLPDGRYAQLLVPGGEAQEAAGFALIGKTQLDRDANEPASAWVVAHEMAHQYWGNLVTCASWQDFWLNEGVATFMTAAWLQHSVGDAAYRRELDLARGRVDRVRALGFDKPLAWAGKYPSLAARRAVQYSKGALFLAHLRESLGEAVFWRGLRDFTRRHAGGSVTSRDFQRAMEQASGRDLSALFIKWVYGDPAAVPQAS
jgi:aminopeptidase N